MKLGLESVRYTMREGHFEVAPQFHVSQALLCRYIFSNRDLLAGMAEALIDYFELLERPALLLDADSTSGICLASLISGILIRHSVRDFTEGQGPLRDRAYLILLPNLLTNDQIRQGVARLTTDGAFVAGVGAICDRRQHRGDVDGVKVWAPISLVAVGVNADLDVESCLLCRDGEPLNQGLRVI